MASRYEQARLLSNDPVALSTIGALWLGVGVAAIFATVGLVSSVALQALIVLLLLVVSLTATALLRRVGVGGLLRVGEDL